MPHYRVTELAKRKRSVEGAHVRTFSAALFGPSPLPRTLSASVARAHQSHPEVIRRLLCLWIPTVLKTATPYPRGRELGRFERRQTSNFPSYRRRNKTESNNRKLLCVETIIQNPD